MPDETLVLQLEELARRIRATPVQVEDAHTVERAAEALRRSAQLSPQMFANVGVARAICAEVSGLSPEVKEDVDDVLRALEAVTGTSTQPGSTTRPPCNCGCGDNELRSDLGTTRLSEGTGDGLLAEIQQGLDYYARWEAEARHEEQVQHQQAIRNDIEGEATYAEMAHNGEMIALGKLVAVQHVHGWLKLHVLPKLAAARLSIEGGEEGLRKRFLSGEVGQACEEALDLLGDVREDRPLDGVVETVLTAALDAVLPATTHKPQDEERKGG